MPTRYYRPTVLGCVLAWFLVGLHVPALHEIVDHGAAPSPTVLGATSLLTVAGLAALWRLLRVR